MNSDNIAKIFNDYELSNAEIDSVFTNFKKDFSKIAEVAYDTFCLSGCLDEHAQKRYLYITKRFYQEAISVLDKECNFMVYNIMNVGKLKKSLYDMYKRVRALYAKENLAFASNELCDKDKEVKLLQSFFAFESKKFENIFDKALLGVLDDSDYYSVIVSHKTALKNVCSAKNSDNFDIKHFTHLQSTYTCLLFAYLQFIRTEEIRSSAESREDVNGLHHVFIKRIAYEHLKSTDDAFQFVVKSSAPFEDRCKLVKEILLDVDFYKPVKKKSIKWMLEAYFDACEQELNRMYLDVASLDEDTPDLESRFVSLYDSHKKAMTYLDEVESAYCYKFSREKNVCQRVHNIRSNNCYDFEDLYFNKIKSLLPQFNDQFNQIANLYSDLDFPSSTMLSDKNRKILSDVCAIRASIIETLRASASCVEGTA